MWFESLVLGFCLPTGAFSRTLKGVCATLPPCCGCCAAAMEELRETATTLCFCLKEVQKIPFFSLLWLLVLLPQQGTQEDAGAGWGRDSYSAGDCLGEPGRGECLRWRSLTHSIWGTPLLIAPSTLRFPQKHAGCWVFGFLAFLFPLPSSTQKTPGSGCANYLAVIVGLSSVLLSLQLTHGRAKPCLNNSQTILT